MFCVPNHVPKSELSKLKFALEQFHIFDEHGVISAKRSRKYIKHSFANKFRMIDPVVGDPVGLFTHTFFVAYQIEAIGIVVAKRGKPMSPIYDVFIIDSDPNKWGTGFMDYNLEPRVNLISTGVKTNIEAKNLVFLKKDKSSDGIFMTINNIKKPFEDKIHQAIETLGMANESDDDESNESDSENNDYSEISDQSDDSDSD